MDELCLLAAARSVELNPGNCPDFCGRTPQECDRPLFPAAVRAKLTINAEEWPWSSARTHLSGRDDRLAKVAPLLAMGVAS